MISTLWKNRDRHPLGTSAWARAWAKRLQQTRSLVEQAGNQRWMVRNGASLGELAWISSTKGISGKLGDLRIGSETFIGRVTLALHDRVTIGRCVCINDGAQILTASHDVRSEVWATKSAPIVVRDYAWIATNAIILPGVTIGFGAVVGAGAVVGTDVPDFGIAVGNRAELLPGRRSSNLNYSPVAFTALYRAWCSTWIQCSEQTGCD